jgi:DNA-directed RNA polymerase subunit beta'
MGHISLASPVTNILIFKNLAANLSRLLKIPTKSLEDIIYFRNYVVIDNGLTTLLKKKEILGKKIDTNLIRNILQEIVEDKNLDKNVTNQAKKLAEKISEKKKKQELEITTVCLEDYLDFLEKHRQVKIGIGTEAFQQLLKEIDIEEELKKLKKVNKEEAPKGTNESIRFLEGLRKTEINLE